MSKRSDKDPTTIQDGDTSFHQSSQLNTVLGEYAGDVSGKKTSISTSTLILTILLIVALLGAGAFAYMKQSEIATTQNKFLTINQQLDEVNAAAAQVLQGSDAKWTTLDNQFKNLQNSWAQLDASFNLEKPSAQYKLFGDSVRSLTALKNELNLSVSSMKLAQESAALNSDYILSKDAFTWLLSINKAKNEIAALSNTAVELKNQLHSAQAVVTNNISGIQKIAAYAAILLAILIALLMIITMRKIKTYEAGVSVERNNLKALVDDWQTESEEQRVSTQERYSASQRINEANQAAILRLMNELQNLAEGDLTQQATVTEDITGAIADSVNYTMEELRSLVSQVQGATELVSKTTANVESTSTELLASSDEQLREIRETGKAVLDVAERITGVSSRAQESASVAHQSMDAAEKGMLAVQNAIGGMNTIRDQIQDTSKRIKRLVESSQEIGEITDLIADITEQTNILALNAAIQAASAGEAGRGFSIVAEEVQRLAERSAGATRQIASLIRAIQSDMHDAMEAMERSTHNVVEGARQTDETGTAFTEIDSVTRRLASLIQQISEETQNEAKVANGVAESIQHIFAVTEQTADGTRSTAVQVGELARVAEQLERSVARFRIS